jgi:methionine synthase II (cobalamin-independent)
MFDLFMPGLRQVLSTRKPGLPYHYQKITVCFNPDQPASRIDKGIKPSHGISMAAYRPPPPFRAEHMGSLLRPQPLLDARQAIRHGKTSEEVGLTSLEKQAVADVVRLQQSLGFRAVTSGEFVRTRFWGLMWDEFEGTTRLQDAEAGMFRLYHPDVVSLIEKDRKVMPGDSVIAGGKLRHDPKKSQANLHELKLVQDALPRENWGDIKLTLITPAWFHMRYKQGRAYTPEAYKSDAEYFADVAKVYQAELDELYRAGLRNVQFDDPGLACKLTFAPVPICCLCTDMSADA